MKFNKLLQSLFLSVLVVGLFAAMARNAYGYTLMGTALLGLALLYLVQALWRLVENFTALDKTEIRELIELFLLASLLTLFGFRAFFIYLTLGEMLFNLVCLFLILFYGTMLATTLPALKKESKVLKWGMAFIYSSLCFFFLGWLTRLAEAWSAVFGLTAMVLSLPVVFLFVRRTSFTYAGKTITLFRFIAISKTKAGLLFLSFLSMMLLAGLGALHLVPEIENTDRPKAYIELINQAESGKEKPVDGKYHHQAYKEAMDSFLKRNKWTK